MKSVELTSTCLSVVLLPYGARIARINFNGYELALGYQKLSQYLQDSFYLGASIGPITNPIANGRFTVNGRTHHLPINEGNNCLHSGSLGFDKLEWAVADQTQTSAIFSTIFDLSQMNIEGELRTLVRYQVQDNSLLIEYQTEASVDTFVNTTNHVYLNLSGNSIEGLNQSISDHEFTLYGENSLVCDSANLPTGERRSMQTPLHYNVTKPCKISEFNGGIDHHFNAEEKNDRSLKRLLSAKSTLSGISALIESTSPGYQFYTARYLGAPFQQSGGFCVEPQYAPNAINHPDLYSPTLRANQSRSQLTKFTFMQ